jgi:hypothetical protein
VGPGMLAGIGQQEQRELVLEPGDYPGPWRFGAAHAGVTIRAAGPGVRVIATGVGEDVPLVRCEPGLSDFWMTGVDLQHPGGVALEAMSGARATVGQAAIAGRVVANGAQLTLRALQLRGGLVLDLQGGVVMEDCLVTAHPALTLRDGRAEVSRSRLVGSGSGAVVIGLNGQLDLDAVVVESDVAGSIGLDLGAGVGATLRDVSIRSVSTGVRVDGGRLPAVSGLSVVAHDTGLWWRGQRDPAWSWERLHLQAPTPVQGLDLVSAAEGARPERLGLVP